MLDGDVRVALHARLAHQHRHEANSTLIIDELAVAGQVRVDTVVLNGRFAGYEIKSARDTLRRLPKQVEVYSAVLDRATLVVAESHTEKALDLLPGWWGVIEVRETSARRLRLVETRRGRSNPHVDTRMLCTLLWRDEALAALSAVGADVGYRSKPRNAISERLAAVTPRDELIKLVRETLKARSNWRVGSQ